MKRLQRTRRGSIAVDAAMTAALLSLIFTAVYSVAQMVIGNFHDYSLDVSMRPWL